MNNEEEIWKDIEGYEGLYQVSNFGRVKSLERVVEKRRNPVNERILKEGYSRGYKKVALAKDKNNKMFQVHRLVAKAFIPNPDNKSQVNHKNGIKNDNRVSNLEWCTPSENNLHKFKVLKYKISQDTRDKLSERATGRKWDEYQKENLKKILTGLEKPKAFKPVLCVETQCVYKSVKEASMLTGIKASNISNVCNKKPKNKTAGGYKWEFINKENYNV